MSSSSIAFVTGASEGIGKEVVRELLNRGWSVVFFSRSEKKLAEAKADLQSNRKSPTQLLEWRSVDLTNPHQTEAVLSQAVSDFGLPELLVNCAGYARPGYFDQIELEQIRKMMDLNFFGIVHACKALAPKMMRARKGMIVNTSSIAGFIGLFGYTGYCASKYAVVGFSEALGRELEPYNVRVRVLAPPNTRTPGLDEENKYKSPEILKTEEKAKPVDPQDVAKALVDRLDKSEFMIHPTFDGRLAHKLARHLPQVLSRFVKRSGPLN